MGLRGRFENRVTMTVCPTHITAVPAALSGGAVAASVREENAR
jgi:hypothetical protein